MKRVLLIITYIILLKPSSGSADTKFYNINDMYGVSMRETESICKDGNGFIWVSSKTGILRLAGDHSHIYQLPYQSTDVVNVRLVCRNERLLAYTNNGQVFRYNTLYDRFDFISYAGRMLNQRHLYIHALLIDRHDDLWIASSHGLYCFRNGLWNLAETDITEVISATRKDDRQIAYIKNDEIKLIDIESLQTERIYHNHLLSSLRISTLHHDPTDNVLWIGTVSDGLFHFDFERNTLVKLPLRFFPGQPVRSIEACTDSTFLIGIDGQGVWEIGRQGRHVYNIYKENVDDPFSLRGNGVYDVFHDPDRQRVWLCTYTGGLSFFDRTAPPVNQIAHQINNPNSLTNNNVNKILEDSRKNLWFATENGVCRWDVQADKWTAFYHNRQEGAQVFLSLCEDDRGRIWASSYSSGVYVIDGTTGRELAHYSKDTQGHSLSSNFVFDICKDSQGDLWLGGVMGDVTRYVSQENTFRSYPQLPVYAYAELSPDRMLAACTYGLCLLDKITGRTEVLLEGYLLRDLLVMGDDVWLCVRGGGLIRFNLKNKTSESFTVETGLPSNIINSIEEHDGYLWLGTENGLCRFDPGDKSTQTYTSLLPLSGVSANHNSHCKLHNGQLAFGTNRGAILFDPEALRQMHTEEGRIFFRDLTISGRSVRDPSIFKLTTPLDSLNEIALNYTQNNLTLELLPLGNTLSGVRFSWKMHDQDAEWSQPTEHRIIAYTNIPVGRFELHIKMYDSSLSQTIAERRLTIRIAPPFWQTLWFRLSAIAFLIGITCFTLRFYVNHLKRCHMEDKIQFFTNTAHDLRTSLTLIKAPVEELRKERTLSENGKHYLHLASEQIGRLTSVATRLLDFQKADVGKGQPSLDGTDLVQLITRRKIMFDALAQNRNIRLIFTTRLSTYITAVDESMIEKVIDNLISNAIKYSCPDNLVRILLSGDPKSWTLEVIDHGIGVSRKAQKKLFREFYRSENAVNTRIVGSGIGLLQVKKYVELHNGTVRCISRENEGSTFRVVIPYREASEKKKTTTSATAPSPPASTETAKRDDIRILIVEDNDDLRNFMLTPLREKFHVTTADDGAQAWEIILTQPPELIISDVMMPLKNGFELCEQVKSTFETAHIAFILLTTLTGKAEQLHGLGLGADDYLTKPFDMTLLIRRIETLIRNRNILKEKALQLIVTKRDEPVLRNELNDRFVKKAVETVRLNLSDSSFGKDEFASSMNVSTSLLYKKLKTLTDQSPTDFIKSIRMNHAIEMLRSHKHTVTEISEQCGYSSIGYFSSAFKTYFGKAPTDL
jgi:signal transduction histidine kinase/DNA-binding response OmpR family regulator/ligand-binding sensor domain-containing protein